MSNPAATSLDFRNTNSLWCSVLVETLFRLGLRQAVISPGSRSAPLAFALARHPGIESIPVLDERSAAFFALGLAKRQVRPVALVCTSGTAVANYLPAVVEAHESGVPLLVLSADRPPELRDCHSGQTIRQSGIFGAYVNHAHECAVPEASLAMLRYLRQTAAHAFVRCLRPFPGPVHLNCPFRDPLPPVPDQVVLPPPSRFRGFFSGLRTSAPSAGGASGVAPIRWAQRGIIVVGPVESTEGEAFTRAIRRVSHALGWPVLADALSPVRMHAGLVGALVANYDALLRNAAAAAALRPSQVICIGGWPTSKVLRSWLQVADPEVVLVAKGAANEDGLHLRTTRVQGSAEEWSRNFAGRRATSAYARDWLKSSQRAGRILAAGFRTTQSFIEPRWPAVLAATLPQGTPCFIASSMPVRDAEYFWPVGNRRHQIYFNRGANGIDGTLSTALGVAHGGAPAVLVTGDLALLHDANGFLSGPELRGSLTILLINNQGGGIFGHLPVAQFAPVFERFFATPQQIDFARLAAAHGVRHVLVRDEPHLVRLLTKLPSSGIRLLEMRTDRKQDAAWRKQVFGLAAAG